MKRNLKFKKFQILNLSLINRVYTNKDDDLLTIAEEVLLDSKHEYDKKIRESEEKWLINKNIFEIEDYKRRANGIEKEIKFFQKYNLIMNEIKKYSKKKKEKQNENNKNP